MKNEPRVRAALGIVELLAGTWLFFSPLVLGIAGAGQWHLYFWGATIVMLGGFQAQRGGVGERPVVGVSIGILLVGLWIAISPLFYTYETSAAVWSNILTGIVLAASGLITTAGSTRRNAAARS